MVLKNSSHGEKSFLGQIILQYQAAIKSLKGKVNNAVKLMSSLIIPHFQPAVELCNNSINALCAIAMPLASILMSC